MSPHQLKSPNLHKVLEYEKIKPYIYGAKGVGSQGDGCCQLLCRSEKDAQVVMDIIKEDLHMSSMPCTIGGGKTEEELKASRADRRYHTASKMLKMAKSAASTATSTTADSTPSSSVTNMVEAGWR